VIAGPPTDLTKKCPAPVGADKVVFPLAMQGEELGRQLNAPQPAGIASALTIATAIEEIQVPSRSSANPCAI